MALFEERHQAVEGKEKTEKMPQFQDLHLGLVQLGNPRNKFLPAKTETQLKEARTMFEID